MFKHTPFDLTSKTVLITGAAGLLGQEHAKAVLECHAQPILTDIDEAELGLVASQLSNLYPEANIRQFVMDVTDKGSVINVHNALASTDCRVDILINNAAIDSKVNDTASLSNGTRLENFPLESWNREINVGLTGALTCTQVFGSEMANNGNGGVIVNIASDLSVISPYQPLYKKSGLPDHLQPVKPVTYSVIKTGLIGLTRYVATYWASSGVRCNALSPGGIFTNQSESFVEKVTSLIPQSRMANANEYHSAIQFLCSNASSYMTGQNLIIDGGRSCW
ncbi:SDR family oxidoreductase [Synechococcus sp. UW179B]|uniref:SDR family oxidoreductase n=1 Tax=Synechococcus sp. UW179B TaxID=2575516 RepID=UPI000E0F84F0|nr:SDR family oxidoreductase [Synechococcus sp. UW179B]